MSLFIYLPAWGKKLFLSLAVLAEILHNHVSEGRGTSSPWTGWVHYPVILVAFFSCIWWCTHQSSYPWPAASSMCSLTPGVWGRNAWQMQLYLKQSSYFCIHLVGLLSSRWIFWNDRFLRLEWRLFILIHVRTQLNLGCNSPCDLAGLASHLLVLQRWWWWGVGWRGLLEWWCECSGHLRLFEFLRACIICPMTWQEMAIVAKLETSFASSQRVIYVNLHTQRHLLVGLSLYDLNVLCVCSYKSYIFCLE